MMRFELAGSFVDVVSGVPSIARIDHAIDNLGDANDPAKIEAARQSEFLDKADRINLSIGLS